ncbi:MAG: ATPase P, partial [Deltaproteobacteria bacterium]|nr:ATPase P [Deltaproteobacteria bacterium]
MDERSQEVEAWHALDAPDVLARLKTDPERGLSRMEVAERLRRYGTNTLETASGTGWYVVFARQFVSALILVLVVAAAIALSIGDVTDVLTILAIVLLNGVLGFVQ